MSRDEIIEHWKSVLKEKGFTFIKTIDSEIFYYNHRAEEKSIKLVWPTTQKI